jgi:preprotein translocase subunit Sss1
MRTAILGLLCLGVIGYLVYCVYKLGKDYDENGF